MLLGALLAPAAALPLYPIDGGPSEPPPNVLVVVLDDVGTDKVAAYGEHPRPPSTPRIDALAATGVRFRNAYAYPVCSPTRAALLTGRYARRTGMGAIVPWRGTYELPLGEVTLPELLDLGPVDYATAAVGKWHLSGIRTANALRHPTLQGFDRYTGALQNLYFDEARERSDYFGYDKVVDGQLRRVQEYATTATTDDALTALAAMKEPWMLYVAYNAAHTPLHVPPGSNVPSDAPPPVKYDAMVANVDREVGRLLDGLGEQRARTVVLLVGDNGTEKRAIVAPRDPSHGKGTLFEGGTNVPLLVSGPGIARGAVSEALVHVVDVLPTVAELAHVDPVRSGRPVDGASFAAVLKDPTAPGPRRFVYTEEFQPAGPPPWKNDGRAIRDERYKLMVAHDGTELFYDLQGRDDDGPARPPSVLLGEEKTRYDALKAELDRLATDLRYAW